MSRQRKIIAAVLAVVALLCFNALSVLVWWTSVPGHTSTLWTTLGISVSLLWGFACLMVAFWIVTLWAGV